MERKRIIEVGIAAAVLVALVFLVWWLTRTPEPQVVEEKPAVQTPYTPPPTPAPSTVTNAPQVQEVSASTVARTFVERMGSYSSESDYQNVNDVTSLVTTQLAAKLSKDAQAARAQAPSNGGYYGISTSYIGAKNIEESETRIVLLVQTQREESFGSPGNSEVRYQTIEVTLVKEQEDWKVSTYTWGD